jgi:hypothetical protein
MLVTDNCANAANVRAETIEECAKIADIGTGSDYHHAMDERHDIAIAIRAILTQPTAQPSANGGQSDE